MTIELTVTEQDVIGVYEEVLSGKRRCEHRLTLRLYSATDLKTLLADAGFEDVKVYGSLTGAPYNHEARRLVLVGRKT